MKSEPDMELQLINSEKVMCNSEEPHVIGVCRLARVGAELSTMEAVDAEKFKV